MSMVSKGMSVNMASEPGTKTLALITDDEAEFWTVNVRKGANELCDRMIISEYKTWSEQDCV